MSGQMGRIRVGVAGWDYRDWRGVLYPEPRPAGFDPVRYLARYVEVIEINSTFYRPPQASYAARWAARVADLPDFRYTAKLYGRFTRQRDTPWKAAEVREVQNGFAPLLAAKRLGALVLQFPWSFRNDEAGREWLDDLRSAFAELPLVVEVRHQSWNHPDFFEWLAENGAGFVNIDQPQCSKSISPSARATARIGYVRVHGRNYQDWFRKGAGRDARYDYLYSVAELRPWVSRVRAVARDPAVKEVDVIFNNHYRAQAAVNALQFRKLLTRRVVKAPATLGAEYAEALKAAGVRIEDPSAG
jgi:uncharacterized protein YecE (DUF72 family)